jgi:RHS repeat-associated protein
LAVTNAFDNFLRRTAVALSSEPSTLVNFGYDDTSRLQSVTNGPSSIVYGYVANSPLVQNIAFKSNGATRMITVKSYDNLNRLTQIASTAAADAAVTFSYQYNSANQRLGVTNADNSFWAYKYDVLGQVTAGKKYWSDNTPVAGEQFEYTFDDIGNRQSASIGGDQLGGNLRSASYSANILNQYTNRTVPGFVNILGSANSNATVTLWGSDGTFAATTRKGTYFRAEYDVDNNSSALWLTITNVAVLTSGANPDIVTNTTGNVFIPQSPESFAYDDDGNLTSDGRWTYTWDAENRLISMVSLANAPVASKLKLDFSYDYQGRRIQKLVSTNSGSAYVLQTASRFVYDGWNLLATLDAQSSLVQSFVWGLDLSGSPQGAGGVGGLVMVTDVTQGWHFPTFDGNGNIAALVRATDGTVSAIYEYGPFGEVLRMTGSVAKFNPLQFSTKYADAETGFAYYGYRYYDSSTGRWLSRDPIGEDGGPNIYGFVGNGPCDAVDALGNTFWKPWTWGDPTPSDNILVSKSGDWYSPPLPLVRKRPTRPSGNDLVDEVDEQVATLKNRSVVPVANGIHDTAIFLLELTPQHTFSVVFLGEDLTGQRAGVGERITCAVTSGPGISYIGGKAWRISGALLKKLRGKSAHEIEEILTKECCKTAQESPINPHPLDPESAAYPHPDGKSEFRGLDIDHRYSQKGFPERARDPTNLDPKPAVENRGPKARWEKELLEYEEDLMKRTGWTRDKIRQHVTQREWDSIARTVHATTHPTMDQIVPK